MTAQRASHAGLTRQFVQGGRQPPAGGVAQAVNARRHSYHVRDQPVQRRRIGLQCGFELQVFTAGHDGYTVISNTAAE